MADHAPVLLVPIGRGLLVEHTREEWETFMRGVDREAAEQHNAILRDEDLAAVANMRRM